MAKDRGRSETDAGYREDGVLPDLQLLSDRAREQFADMLGEVDGPKDVVIQSELMSLLEHVTPMKFLRRYIQCRITMCSNVCLLKGTTNP